VRVFSSKLAPMITSYLEFRAAMGFSDVHERNLHFFDRFCCENYPEIECLSKEAVRAWISDEVAKGRGGFECKASAIRVFARYLGGDSYVLPRSAIPKKQTFTPYILTDVELAALFKATENVKGIHDPFLRETASVLWRLLYTCGLRPREGRLIKYNDICFQSGEILVTKAKRSKERIVVMSDDMLDMCKSYRIRRLAVTGHNEYFFVNGKGSSLEAFQLFFLFRRCWEQANPDTPPHLLPNLRQYDLRHRYASAVLQKWLDEGRNLYAMLPYLRTYMGHERFTDTAYYIHILPENLLKSPGIDWDKLDSIVPEVGIWED